MPDLLLDGDLFDQLQRPLCIRTDHLNLSRPIGFDFIGLWRGCIRLDGQYDLYILLPRLFQCGIEFQNCEFQLREVSGTISANGYRGTTLRHSNKTVASARASAAPERAGR